MQPSCTMKQAQNAATTRLSLCAVSKGAARQSLLQTNALLEQVGVCAVMLASASATCPGLELAGRPALHAAVSRPAYRQGLAMKVQAFHRLVRLVLLLFGCLVRAPTCAAQVCALPQSAS